jgi:hypothetical protein
MMAGVTVPAIVHEATRKGAVVWVSAGRAPKPVWHVWHDGADWVLHGGGEQQVDGLADATSATVGVRAKSNGAGLVTWVASVTTVDPTSEEWAAVEPLLRKARLHAEPDPTARWRAGSTLSKLTPTGEIRERSDGKAADDTTRMVTDPTDGDERR